MRGFLKLFFSTAATISSSEDSSDTSGCNVLRRIPFFVSCSEILEPKFSKNRGSRQYLFTKGELNLSSCIFSSSRSFSRSPGI